MLEMQWQDPERVDADVEVSGKRGIAALKFRGIARRCQRYTQFEDKPSFDAVDADRRSPISKPTSAGKIDRLDVVYTRFVTALPGRRRSRRCSCRLKAPEPAVGTVTADPWSKPVHRPNSGVTAGIRVLCPRREHSGGDRAGELSLASSSSVFSTQP